MNDATGWNSAWIESTDKLATQFHIMIFKLFLFLRRLWIRFGYIVSILSPRCLRMEASSPASRKLLVRIVHSISFSHDNVFSVRCIFSTSYS